MAYITEANAKNIIAKTEIKSLNLEGVLYKNSIYFFNKLEKNWLLALKELFSDSEKFFSEYYEPQKTKDTYTYIYEGRPPAYHLVYDCQRLYSDYENFEIPEAIKVKGKEEVKKFRMWFSENRYLLSKPDVFVARLKMRWNIDTNPNAINKSNSGSEVFMNYKTHDLIQKIDALIKLAGELYHDNTIILSKYNKHSYLGYKIEPLSDNDTGFSDSDVKEVLKEFETRVKKPLKDLLVQYYRVKLNPKLDLYETVLKQLGFQPCQLCHSENLITNDIVSNKVNELSKTVNETFLMIKQGLGIEEIASSRQLTVSSIISHIEQIAKIIGTDDLSKIKPTDRVISDVKKAITKIGGADKLRPIYEVLNEEISFSDIKISLLFI